MNSFVNKYDPIEEIIHKNDIRIVAIHPMKELDQLVIFLNTGYILRERLSQFKKLASANDQQLKEYKLIARGTGIHWPGLDEDLSLKGFLINTLQMQIIEKQAV